MNTDNSSSDYTGDDFYGFEYEFTFPGEHIWMIITSLLNIVANILILITTYRIRSKSSAHRFICLLAASDIFAHLFSGDMFQILANFHNVFRHFFFNHFDITGKMLVVLVLTAMVLRKHFQFVEKFHIIIIILICITMGIYFTGLCFLPPLKVNGYTSGTFVLIILLLFIATYIEQVMHVIHLDKPVPQESKLLSLIAVIYINFRILLLLAEMSMYFEIITNASSALFFYIFSGAVDLNSIVNIILLVYNDVSFKMRFCEMFRLNSLMRNNHVEFVNTPDGDVNMQVINC